MSELIEIISHESGHPKSVVAEVLKAEHTITLRTVKTGEPVVLTNFGVFKQVVFKKKVLFGQPLARRKVIRFRVSRRSR